MDFVDGTHFFLLKSLCSVDNLTNHLSLQCSSWGLITAINWGVKVMLCPKTKTYKDQSMSNFFDRVRVKTSIHSSNCLTPTSRIAVVARQPQQLCLVPMTSHTKSERSTLSTSNDIIAGNGRGWCLEVIVLS